MSLSSYEYDRGSNRGRGMGRLRAVMIFIATLCVIGAGVYFLLPHQGKKPSSEPEPVDAPPTFSTPENVEGSANGSGNTTAGNSAAGNAAPELGNTAVSGDATETSTPRSGQTTEQPTDKQAMAIAPSAGSTSVGPANANSETGTGDPTPTEVPQKGKPWTGDPEDDAPSAAGEVSETDRLLVPDVQREMQVLRVRAGDSLSRLAARHHTTVEALRHYNGLKKDVIRIGQKLRFIPGPWRISVDKKSRILTVERCRDGVWSTFARFAVGLGRFNSTPTAEFVISTRLRHPDWYTGDGRIYRYGDPENQLGDYFLKLAPAGSPEKPLRGYGIHGTPDDGSVGKNWSNGCIRMHNREVELLYYLVPSGTPVKILSGAENTPPNGELKHE